MGTAPRRALLLLIAVQRAGCRMGGVRRAPPEATTTPAPGGVRPAPPEATTPTPPGPPPDAYDPSNPPRVQAWTPGGADGFGSQYLGRMAVFAICRRVPDRGCCYVCGPRGIETRLST